MNKNNWNDDEEDIAEQIQRCRRIASVMVDDELRHSFEELAKEYEAKLPKRRDGFMMRRSEEDGGDAR